MKIEASLETQNDALFRANRYVARTKYYKKLFGTWQRRKADVYVNITGVTSRGYCGGNEKYVNKTEAKYGSGVSVVYRVYDSDIWGGLRAQNNKIYSRHKVWNANFKRKDYYDGQLFTY